MVLQPNYHGSGGRGVEFSKADHEDLGGLEFDDILAGVNYLIDQSMVDPDRLGTGGWSYGGYLSAWAATRHSDRFKAAMVGAGISNWISFTGTTDIPIEMSVVHWDSWWFDEPQLHWDRSPLAHINKAQTPTLVIHGQKDDRVHPEQGLELYQALRIKGVDTRLVLYPRQPHGLKERAHRLDYMNRLVAWFNKYVK
jgi:dipeptidyl aminopeptidase/acylaminoacyl peptidase